MRNLKFILFAVLGIFASAGFAGEPTSEGSIEINSAEQSVGESLDLHYNLKYSDTHGENPSDHLRREAAGGIRMELGKPYTLLSINESSEANHEQSLLLVITTDRVEGALYKVTFESTFKIAGTNRKRTGEILLREHEDSFFLVDDLHERFKFGVKLSPAKR